MLIISVELNGFKRFSLNLIYHFKLKPTAREQLILGTNGSGKSSLIAELSPLPAAAANFTKDGSKTIILLHRGHEYTLKSDFANAHVHSFLKSGEEFNPGGTLTVQKELVWQEFGIRQEIHDLITGVEKFTQMSPSRRREWFTEMSDSNYDYALLVYGRLKDASRDVAGALKLAKKRLVTETAKLLGEDDLLKIKEKVSGLHSEIDFLYQMRIEQPHSQEELKETQARLEREAVHLCQRLFHLQSGGVKWLTPEALKEKIEELKTEATTISTKMELLVKEHAQLKEQQDACVQRGATGLDELKLELRAAQDRRKSLLETRKLALDTLDPHASLGALEALYPLLQQVFSQLPENKDRRLSQVTGTRLQNELLAVRQKIYEIETNLQTLRHQKHHLDEMISGEKTVCPQCNHTWVPGYSAVVYAKLLEVIASLVEKHEMKTKEVKKLDEAIEENKAYGELFKEYLIAVRSTPVLQSFWDHLTTEDLPHSAPRQVEVKMETFKHDLNQEIEAQRLFKQIEKTKDLIQMAIKSSDVDIQKVTTRMDAVEIELGLFSQNLRQLQNTLQKTQNTLSKVNEFLSLEVKIKNYQSLLENGVTEMVKALKNKIVNEALRTLQVELATQQKLLNDIQMQQAIISDIQAQVKNLEKEEEALKLLVRELSPTDGLIAEGLLGFIQKLVRKMNIIIRKIWTYPLEVQDCSTANDDGAGLDYKFPLKVNENENPVADVRLASLGQKEVIDLAFKIVSTQQLNLSEAGLFLDEWSVFFDEAHRVNAATAIKSLLEQLPFSQLWMVSHYEESHGVFTNAQVCVLSPTNIAVPKEYNLHVEIA